MSEADAVEWTRRKWADLDQVEPDRFAAMAAILRAHQALVAALEEDLGESDLTLNGYLLLTTLLMSRDSTRPLGQLSKHLMLHPTTVTMLVDQLEQRGLVARKAHVSDRRVVLAKLTPAGRRLTVKASKLVAASHYGVGGIDIDEARRLTVLLRKVREKLGDPV